MTEPTPLHTYEQEIHCNNCMKSTKQKIPKGTLVVDFKFTCSNCGCSTQQIIEDIEKRQARVARPIS